MSKTYYDIALNEYQYLQHNLGISTNRNNPNAAFCQQISEKMLKHILSDIDPSAQELRIHNLKKINASLKRNNVNLQCNDLELAYLTDFYFDARYPGDDYIDVSDEDLQKCVDIMEDIKYKVESYLKYRKEEKLDNSSIIDKAIKSMFTG